MTILQNQYILNQLNKPQSASKTTIMNKIENLKFDIQRKSSLYSGETTFQTFQNQSQNMRKKFFSQYSTPVQKSQSTKLSLNFSQFQDKLAENSQNNFQKINSKVSFSQKKLQNQKQSQNQQQIKKNQIKKDQSAQLIEVFDSDKKGQRFFTPQAKNCQNYSDFKVRSVYEHKKSIEDIQQRNQKQKQRINQDIRKYQLISQQSKKGDFNRNIQNAGFQEMVQRCEEQCEYKDEQNISGVKNE
ncbi:hypothetical protein PPERSA_01409 [Pseudocohnilembus persalinus]|uniref:Uncharacterized protein n=1 Tax=Pseudocohnilembus persalinus TaxID=266149 RepID=A0A0V0QH10_PSEPJ|nr:hypothetical protein PPERSA_01409 [Pseudocohnilembus persalinus]|eukprot:KRX01506.1 hypothetical protein PPERSA_01409 [Pseudocohnilembus persalinus]